MRALFVHTVRMLLRRRDVLIWVVLFPLALATLFQIMFSNFDEYYRVEPASCVVVDDENYRSPQAMFFRDMLDAVSEPDDDQVLSVSMVATPDEGRAAVLAGDAAACITVDNEGLPSMQVSPLSVSSTTGSLDQSIVRAVLDQYRQTYAEMKQTFTALPLAQGMQVAPSQEGFESLAATPGMQEAASAFMSDAVKTQQVDVLRVKSSSTTRYFYALMGFASLMSITVAICAVSATRANTSAVGARRQVAGVSPAKQMAVTMAASFVAVFGCLLLAFAYMRFVLGVEFGGRDGLTVVAIATCALMSTALGAAIGAIPSMPTPGKEGLATGITCLCALFAGLYGEPSMQLADQIAQHAPWAALINPAAQAANAFYDLTYYDSLAPFSLTMCVLFVMAAAFFAMAAVLMRRQNYERL